MTDKIDPRAVYSVARSGTPKSLNEHYRNPLRPLKKNLFYGRTRPKFSVLTVFVSVLFCFLFILLLLLFFGFLFLFLFCFVFVLF